MIGLIGLGFSGGLLAFATAIAIVGSRRHHDKHHGSQTVIGCDRCLRRAGLMR